MKPFEDLISDEAIESRRKFSEHVKLNVKIKSAQDHSAAVKRIADSHKALGIAIEALEKYSNVTSPITRHWAIIALEKIRELDKKSMD
jgi:hypothetical protein